MVRGFSKRVLWVLLVGCLGCVVHWTQGAMDDHRAIHFVDQRPVFLPKGEVLKWLSMGYRGLVADWLWIRSVLYYGRRVLDEDNPYYVYAERGSNLDEELRFREASSPVPDSVWTIHETLNHLLYQHASRGLVDHIYPMLDRVTTVDPRFVLPYLFGGVYVLMDTGEIDEAEKLLEKGYKANPDRWELPFYLGWVTWMYRGHLKRTTQYLAEAVGKEGCPAYVGRLLVGLSRDLGGTQLTRLYLEGMMGSTDNPEIRERMGELLQEIAD